MLKMEIAFDEEKVGREDKYDLEKMYGIVDNAFIHHGVERLKKGVYGNRNRDLGRIFVALGEVEEEVWFKDNAICCMFFCNEDGCIEIEDWLTDINGKTSISKETA